MRKVLGRHAMLVDLDNVAIRRNGLLAPDKVERVLLRTLAATTQAQFRLAVAPSRTITGYAAVLAKLGLRWAVVPVAPDSADRKIVQVAQELRGLGYGSVTVASGDAFFASLVPGQRLEVVVPAGQAVAGALKRAASRIVYV